MSQLAKNKNSDKTRIGEATVLEFLIWHRREIAGRLAAMQSIVSTLDQIHRSGKQGASHARQH